MILNSMEMVQKSHLARRTGQSRITNNTEVGLTDSITFLLSEELYGISEGRKHPALQYQRGEH